MRSALWSRTRIASSLRDSRMLILASNNPVGMFSETRANFSLISCLERELNLSLDAVAAVCPMSASMGLNEVVETFLVLHAKMLDRRSSSHLLYSPFLHFLALSINKPLVLSSCPAV